MSIDSYQPLNQVVQELGKDQPIEFPEPKGKYCCCEIPPFSIDRVRDVVLEREISQPIPIPVKGLERRRAVFDLPLENAKRYQAQSGYTALERQHASRDLLQYVALSHFGVDNFPEE